MTFQDLLNYIKPQANPNGVGTNTGPIYSEPGLVSTGANVQLPFGLPQVGGTLGIDNGQLFGNANVNHKPIAQFGPFDPADKGVFNIDNYLQQLLGVDRNQ
jgi:hypothetical protein